MKKTSAMEDWAVLLLIDRGKYYADPDTGEVFNQDGKTLKPFIQYDGKIPYATVRLYDKDKAKTIAVARFVWMSVTRSVIPPKFEIHHNDLNPEHNCWKNLICLHRLDHQKLHAKSRVEEEIPF